MLKSLLPDDVEVSITIDVIRLKSNLTTNKTIRITKKLFSNTILGFTQSHSGPLSDIEGFIQLIPGTYESEKPTNITGIDKIHPNDCITGSFINRVRELILNSFALDKQRGYKFHKEL